MAWWLIVIICVLVFSLINTIGNLLKDNTNIDETTLDFILGGIFTWLLSLTGYIIGFILLVARKIKNKRRNKND